MNKGKSAKWHKGSNLENGVSSVEKMPMSPAATGMDSKGPGQLPMGIKKETVSTHTGKFTFR